MKRRIGIGRLGLLLLVAASAACGQGKSNVDKGGRASEDANGTRQEAGAEPNKAQTVAVPNRSDHRVYWKDGIRFDTADEMVKLKIGCRLHLDFSFADDDHDVKRNIGRQSDEQEFRRARLYLSGTIHRNFDFKVEYDFDGGDDEFKDVYVEMKDLLPIGSMRVGHFKEPFTLEEVISDNYTTFVERALPNVFAPSRKNGAMIHSALWGKKKHERLTYAVGFFRDTEKFDDDWSEGESAGTARLTLLPYYDEAGNGRRLIHVGAAVSHRDGDGTFDYSERPESHKADTFADTGDFRADDFMLYGLEAAVVLGPFSAQGEYLCVDVDRRSPDVASDVGFDGYYVEASYFITGEHRPYKNSAGKFDRVEPKRDFNPMRGGPGAWQVAARYSRIDLDHKDIQGGSLDNVTLGANWHWNPNMRIMFNYVMADLHRVFGGRALHAEANYTLVRLQVNF